MIGTRSRCAMSGRWNWWSHISQRGQLELIDVVRNRDFVCTHYRVHTAEAS